MRREHAEEKREKSPELHRAGTLWHPRDGTWDRGPIEKEWNNNRLNPAHGSNAATRRAEGLARLLFMPPECRAVVLPNAEPLIMAYVATSRLAFAAICH